MLIITEPKLNNLNLLAYYYQKNVNEKVIFSYNRSPNFLKLLF